MTVPAIVRQHFEELQERYTRLSLVYWRGLWSVEGVLWFTASYNRKVLEDEYSIKISIPIEYPRYHPSAEELLGRIPKNFHHYENGHLCLGTNYAVSRTFDEAPTLLGFTEKSLIPYLYSFTYKSLYGRMPYGELSHGFFGIIEYYQNEFGLKNRKAVIRLLEILGDNYQTTNMKCPCGSKKPISSCHGKKLETMLNIKSSDYFRQEYNRLLSDIASVVGLTSNS